MLSQQGLEVGLHPVLLQSGIDAEVVAGVEQDLGQADQQRVAVAPLDLPQLRASGCRRRLVGLGVGGAGRSMTVHGGLIQFSGL